MPSRRDFLKTTLAGAGAAALSSPAMLARVRRLPSGAIVLSTWNHGLAANDAAYKMLQSGGTALDAVEAGVRVSEDDPNVTSVGYGGYPDETGRVSLDACIMDWAGHCGAVAFVQKYKNPISIARKVMERTNHVLLVGEGADEFAKKMGFEETNLLTDRAREAWLKWKAEKTAGSNYKLPVTSDHHDTIGMVALDAKGRLAGACTTSGLAWKIHGRVGDSPIIGAGMYCDGEVGAAAATGLGEAVIKTCGSFLVVELMRNGLSPQKACVEAVRRVIRFSPEKPQVGFIALNKEGEYGAYAVSKGFQYALHANGKNTLVDAASEVK